MTLTIKQQLDFSWMSQASYLDFVGLNPGNTDALIEKLKSGTNNRGPQ